MKPAGNADGGHVPFQLTPLWTVPQKLPSVGNPGRAEFAGQTGKALHPHELPMKGPAHEDHPKVQELRELSTWSEGQVWSSPELHGNLSGVMKNQLDWIPLNVGAVRPTQGRTLAVMQVSGGSQSFNAVNSLRVLGRWMRMITIPNQSSVPKAWQEFHDDGRMKDSELRDRVVDVMEELYRFTLLTRDYADVLVDRYSERREAAAKATIQAARDEGRPQDRLGKL